MSRRLRAQAGPAAVCALLTVLVAPYVGMAWEWIAPAPTYINLGGQVFLENQDTSEFIAADGWFLIVGLLAGLVCGALGYLRYRQNLGAVLGTAVAALAGAYIAREVGIALGPAPLAQAVIGLADGQTTTATLEVKSDGVLLAWPVGVLLAHLSLIWGLQRPPRRAVARKAVPAEASVAEPSGLPRASAFPDPTP